MSDRKIAVDQNNDGTIDYYTADVISATDYYPFGFEMPGRKYNSDKSVYGFNGKRKDNDIYGEGNAYDFSSRMYNSRLGKWFSVDAVQKKYPAWSPYNYAMNSPLKLKDDDGEDVIVTISGNSITFSSTIYVTGPGATDVAKNANTSFDNFSKSALQNRTYKDAEGKIYNVQIKMNYVAVNPDDPKEDPAKVAAYNSTKNDKVGGSGNNIIQTTADSKLRANAGHPASKSYDMGVMAKQTFIAGNGAEQVRMVNIPSAGNLAYVRND